MFDATELELQRREHAYEMGEDSASDRAWYRFSDAASRAIKAKGWGASNDGDEAEDGFSLDGCYDAWEAGKSVDQWLAVAAEKRRALGLS